MFLNRHLHLELCCIAREFNLLFGMQMTFAMVSYIANITLMCFGLNLFLIQYRKIITLYYWIAICCWILIFITRLYVINYICECVKFKVKLRKNLNKIYIKLICVKCIFYNIKFKILG